MEKTQLINEIIGELYDSVSSETMEKIKNILYVKFNNYNFFNNDIVYCERVTAYEAGAISKNFYRTRTTHIATHQMT